MTTTVSQPVAPNAYRLLYAGFMAILAAGVGYSVRAGILVQWAEQFGFTMTELGQITGGGLTGFGIVIIITSLLADKVGYGKVMLAAFLLHFISAVLTLAAPAAFEASGKPAAFQCLFWGMFIFAVGNGLCEAVVNPLTATLFPKDKTHYLNILHAGWPAGLVLGGLASFFMAAKVGTGGEIIAPPVDWKIQMSLFLIPVILYGALLFGQKFPKSEAASAGLSIGQMVSTLIAPLFLFLLLIHAMVGYVELGTDSWIAKITGSIMGSNASGLALFVYTSLLMFVLRFVAGPIVHRISPLGLLLVSALLGATGLTLLGRADAVVGCVIAATVYACGKTFLWPTMLAVASERFPKAGAVGIGLIGGVGMLSAGLIGGPAIGFQQDYYASQELRSASEPTFERYKAAGESSFMGVTTVGLDGAKVGVLEDNGKELARASKLLAEQGKTDPNVTKLEEWWKTAAPDAAVDKPQVTKAGIYGGKKALSLTAYVPLTMAACYLLLIIGFRLSGGYKAVHIDESPESLGTAES
ncbi:MFS transporter [Planctomicrobium sp. SH661]|uniref:MFS transporter n=1 Tax=Planctomicrobium sp. SH661 TaxID=3448124 RepID=UPI003F5B23D6